MDNMENLGCRKETIKGWNNYPARFSTMYRPERIDDLAHFLEYKSQTILARGGGTTYGDSSINDIGINVDTSRLDKMISFNNAQGILHCQSGVTLQDICNTFIPRGYFLNVTPGTKYATVGGCIATDSHGKNWSAGSFGYYVNGFNIMLRDGKILFCDDNNNSDLFQATIGGMGMTGIIIDAYVKLKNITSSLIDVETIPFNNLKDCISLQLESLNTHEYLFSWIDSQRGGARIGTGVLQRATHVSNSLLQYKEKKKINIPFFFPNKFINAYTVKMFNYLYRTMNRTGNRFNMDLIKFFYPLDSIGNWYRLYGRRGFVEYQIVIPFDGASEVIHELLDIITRSELGSIVSAIKPVGKSKGMISFPKDGFTFAVDFIIHKSLWNILDRLDLIVSSVGGKVYLAKDARLLSESFKKMYSDKLDDWNAIRCKYNPNGGISSMMFHRLLIN